MGKNSCVEGLTRALSQLKCKALSLLSCNVTCDYLGTGELPTAGLPSADQPPPYSAALRLIKERSCLLSSLSMTIVQFAAPFARDLQTMQSSRCAEKRWTEWTPSRKRHACGRISSF